MDIIHTAGDAFNPDERGIMFAAGTAPVIPHRYLVAVNDLNDSSVAEIERLIDDGATVLIDSGIFNLTNDHKRKHNVHMDEALALPPDKIDGFDKLYDRYLRIVRRIGDKSWGYIELDQGGEVNKRKTRARLHAEGLSPIPVYHPLVDSWEYFDELASQYDRICFGNVVQAPMPVRRQLLHTLWERKRNYPHLFVHVLGLTANEVCVSMPVDSCDSSTWLNGLRYPRVNMGSGYMRRIGNIESRTFFYDRSEDAEPSKGIALGEPPLDAPTRAKAAKAYADDMEFINYNWQRIVQDRATILGEVRLPPLTDKETPL